MTGTVHVIGAGLAGLAAAIALSDAGAAVTVHEATNYAGGRCRSYHDHATGLTIDNGNHLVLSANQAALAYADRLGTRDLLRGPTEPEFPFVDLASGERWPLRLGTSRAPWWIFDASRRVPGTRPPDYLRLAPLLWTAGDRPLRDVIPCHGVLHQRLIQPLLLAALNVDPPEGSSRLAAAIVRETLAAGGTACRPLIAQAGLGSVFVEPALALLPDRNGAIFLDHELRAVVSDSNRVTALDFGRDIVTIGPKDMVVLAVPAWAAAALVPGLMTPQDFRAIANVHFRVDPPPGFGPIVGVVNATTEWIFAFPKRLSVTISNADRLMKSSREELARTIWREVATVAGLEHGSSHALPPWQIVRERRATFASTPVENARRPGSETQWKNLFLAGDWTATGLPATIEGAIRSGNRAAELICRA
jgi:squalene-associated FAD-dependent desaturase